MKNFKIALVIFTAALMCLMSACTDTPATTTPAATPDATQGGTSVPTADPTEPAKTPEGTTVITLNNADTSVKGEGADFKDGTVSITKGGVYTLKGTLKGGQIYVKVTKPEEVELVFEGVEITSEKTAALYVESAENVKIVVKEGTVNKLVDSSKYQYAAGVDEPNACIFSADDLTIKGSGSLTVIGNYKNGISSKNDIKIKDVDLTVSAYNTGIRGKDSVQIESGKISVDAGNDGIKSSNTEEAGRGYILVTGGTIDIKADDDGFQAETDLTVKGASVTISAGGKEFNSAGTLDVEEGSVK